MQTAEFAAKVNGKFYTKTNLRWYYFSPAVRCWAKSLVGEKLLRAGASTRGKTGEKLFPSDKVPVCVREGSLQSTAS